MTGSKERRIESFRFGTHLIYFGKAIRDMQKFMPFLLWGKVVSSIAEAVLQVWQPILIAEIFQLAESLNDGNQNQFVRKTALLCICIGFPAVCTMLIRAVGLYGEGKKEPCYGWKMYGFARKLRLEDLEEPKILDSFRKADAAYSQHLAASRMFSYLMIDITSLLVCVSTFLVVGSFSVWLLPGAVLGVLPHLFTDLLFEKRRSRMYRGQAGKRRRLTYLWRLFCTKEPVKEMRTMGFSGFLKEKWVAANVEVIREMEELELKSIRLSAVGVLLKNFSYLANVAIALLLMIRGELAVGQFAACLTAFGLLQDNLSMLSSFVVNFLQSWHHVEEYYDFFRVEEEADGKDAYRDFEQEIVMQDLYFRYPGGEQDALDGVNLTIKKGEHVVIVGVNGSGKTTLSKVLTGVYRAGSGEVRYDEQNISKIRKNELRRTISIVSQDFVHYNFSLRENICISDFRSREDDGRLSKVTEAVGMQELIRGIGGPDAQLGREFGGSELSGGEWQKVAIARGLFRDSSLIILDEPTSALDPLIEYEILANFLKLIQGKTSIIISHRVGICRHADKIVVMKDGKVAECGSHEELQKAGGEYARIWREQAKWY